MVGVLITPLHVEITRFEIPEHLGEHAHFKMSPENLLRATAAFTLPCDEPLPGIGRPGEIDQWHHLFFWSARMLEDCGDQPLPFTRLMPLEKRQRFLQTVISTAGSQVHHGEQAKVLRPMRRVERPEKLLVVIAHMGQMLFTGL